MLVHFCRTCGQPLEYTIDPTDSYGVRVCNGCGNYVLDESSRFFGNFIDKDKSAVINAFDIFQGEPQC